MKALLLASLLVPAVSIAQSPDGTPAPEPTATAPADALPTQPAFPRTWELEAALHNLAIRDDGMHVFSSETWLPGPELRLRRAIAPAFAKVAVAPEVSYGFAHASRSYPSAASTELWLQRFSAGARTTFHVPRLRSITPFVRTGASGLWGTALAHDTYRDYREEAYGWGLYASAGAELDAGGIRGRTPHLVFGAEIGHLYTGGLTFGRMGTLEVNDTFYALKAGLRF